MNKKLTNSILMVALLFGLIGCSDFRRAIGKGKSAPDEFQVVVRPPLSLPPGFADKPEKILDEAKTSSKNVEQRGAALLESKDASGSSFSKVFDFSGVPSDIREKVDEETYGIQLEKRLPLQKLFGGLPDVGPVLDKIAEDNRLRRARRAGENPVNEGTKAIDPSSKSSVVIE